MSDLETEKRRVRALLRERRRGLDARVQALHAKQLRGVVQHQSWFKVSSRVACYMATDGEISLAPVIQLSWQLDKQVYLPVVGPGGRMRFLEYRAGDKLRKNRFGIAEPFADAEECPVEELSLVFAPLVAFSTSGGRLGMGGGYYDRTFSKSRNTSTAGRNTAFRRSGPRLVGAAHQCQRVDDLPLESRDVPMEWVVTEAGVVRPGNSG